MRLMRFSSLITVLLGLSLILSDASVANEPESVSLSVDQWLSPRDGELSFQVVASKTGRRTPLASAEVRIVGGEGVLYQGRTDDLGLVSIEGVEPGIYALLASTPDYFGYYALQVVAASNRNFYPSVGIVPCGSVNQRDFEAAVTGYLPLTRDLKTLASVFRADKHQPQSSRKTGASSVVQLSGGTMNGHILIAGERQAESRMQPAQRANVFLYQNGRRIDHKRTGRDGVFQFRNLSPGTYTVVSAGPDGLGAVGIELVGDTDLVGRDGTRFISRVECCQSFAMQVVPCCDAIVTPAPCCEPLPIISEPIPCCDVMAEPVVEVAPAEVVTEIPTQVAAPVAAPTPSVGGPVGGGGYVGNWPAAPLFPAAAILAASSRDNGTPWQPPQAASPDTQPSTGR